MTIHQDLTGAVPTMNNERRTVYIPTIVLVIACTHLYSYSQCTFALSCSSSKAHTSYPPCAFTT